MTLKIIHKNPVCSFATPWFEPVIQQCITFEPWCATTTYPKNTVFYTNCLDDPAHAQSLLNAGFRVVIDNLWEVNPGATTGAHTITADAWFWYNESLWYQYLGLDQYTPRHNWQYRALMPMNRQRPHRDDFVGRVDLSQLLWSYVAQGRQLPGDQDMSDWATQRYMNPDWYNHTYASMVVETLVNPGSRYTPVFVTEKTFKPIAFEHPFLVYGNRGTLQELHSWGFETFSDLWDESYDQIVDSEQRRDAVIRILHTTQVQSHSAETQRRLQHNKHHFFDLSLVRQRVITEIIEPILAYAETT